jgi:hypothetical protein
MHNFILLHLSHLQDALLCEEFLLEESFILSFF